MKSAWPTMTDRQVDNCLACSVGYEVVLFCRIILTWKSGSGTLCGELHKIRLSETHIHTNTRRLVTRINSSILNTTSRCGVHHGYGDCDCDVLLRLYCLFARCGAKQRVGTKVPPTPLTSTRRNAPSVCATLKMTMTSGMPSAQIFCRFRNMMCPCM